MSARSAVQTPPGPSSQAVVARCGRTAARVLEPGRADRLAARLRSGALDRGLAAGADPTSSPRLAARAAALGSRDGRARIAENLERLIGAAEQPRGAWAVRPDRAAVIANRQAVRDVVEMLHGNAPLYVRGLAAVEQLLRDGTGPVYVGDADRLSVRLESARAALCG